MLMRDYGEDLRVRLENSSGHADDRVLETLAFAEGRLLSIHPFTDFNGRVTRLFLLVPVQTMARVHTSRELSARALRRMGNAFKH